MSIELKKQAAKAALSFIEDNMIVGIGTGSTVNCFIDELATIKHRIDATVSSSEATTAKLKSYGIPVIDLNTAGIVPIYVDGADEVCRSGEMIKGGGGALVREKILAAASMQFICLVDSSKVVNRLGHFPVAVEVIPMARSLVARELVKLGGNPEYREGFTSDNGNIIIDVHDLEILTPLTLEAQICSIPGVVDCGIFANQSANKIIVASESGVEFIE